MKQILAAVAALLPFSAIAADLPARTSTAPVFASVPAIDAFGSLALGYNNWKVFGNSSDGLNVQARATFASTLSGSIGFQADGAYDRSKFSGDGDTLVNDTGSLAGHVFWRNSNAGLVGVIAQGSAKSSTFLSDRNYFVGMEGQYFLGAFTLYGQAAYQDYSLGSGGSTIEASGVALAGQLRYFATPNLMFALKGGYSDMRFDVIDYKHAAWAVGAKAEYRYASSPVSVFVEADQRRGKVTGSMNPVNETEERVMIGGKWSFGTQTLLQRDRSGASLDPFRALLPPALPNVEPKS